MKKLMQLIAVCAAALALAPQVKAAANQWQELNIVERSVWGFSHVLDLYATNCVNNVTNAANATGNTLYPVVNDGTVNFAAGLRVRNFAIYVDKAFASTGQGGGSNIVINIGDSTVTNRFVSAINIGTNIGSGVLETNLSTGLVGYNANLWLQPDKGTNHIYTVGTNLTFHLLYTNALPSTLSSGKIRIFMNAVPLSLLQQNAY